MSGEASGGLSVYRVDDLLNKKTEPVANISTGEQPLRTLTPNPEASEFGHQFAVVLENGQLALFDAENGDMWTLPHDNVTCIGWSTKGKALIAGLQNGTAILYKTVGGTPGILGLVPLPPDVDPSLGSKFHCQQATSSY